MDSIGKYQFFNIYSKYLRQWLFPLKTEDFAQHFTAKIFLLSFLTIMDNTSIVLHIRENPSTFTDSIFVFVST